MDRFGRPIYDRLPAGYGVITAGPLRFDDLLYIWPAGGFMRHDSPEWTSKIEDAADAILALRSTRVDVPAGTRVRSYTLPADNAGSGVAGSGAC